MNHWSFLGFCCFLLRKVCFIFTQAGTGNQRMQPCQGQPRWDTADCSLPEGILKAACFTSPDLAPAGCTASGDRGAGIELESCPSCSSPGPKMEVENTAPLLKNLIFCFFPSCPQSSPPALLLCSPGCFTPSSWARIGTSQLL